jgi:NAD(P)-dependent dehydrogenase (short-subunit alcohol dehydrogenase family)
MALAGAKLFVEQGAHVFISGRRQEALDNAVKLIGRKVTGVQADSASLDELDHLFDAETKAQFEALVPRGKMGSPEVIATVALFLASDDSS